MQLTESELKRIQEYLKELRDITLREVPKSLPGTESISEYKARDINDLMGTIEIVRQEKETEMKKVEEEIRKHMNEGQGNN